MLALKVGRVTLQRVFIEGEIMQQMMRARMSFAFWAVIVISTLIIGISGVMCIISIPGWGKLLGVGVLVFFVLAIFMLIGFGTIDLSEEALEARCILGRYRIEWDEIERLWRDNSGLNWVVEGHGKRVAIPGPSLWRSPHKEAMIGIMKRNFVERDIKPQLSEFRTFLLSNGAAKVSD